MDNASRSATAKAPSQARSRLTYARLVAALERLLRERDWSEITVEEIVEKADVSVGAFYKRFSTKSQLLIALLDKIHADGDERIVELVAFKGPLRDRIAILIDTLAADWGSQAHVVKAAYAAQVSGEAASLTGAERSSRDNLQRIAHWLLERKCEIRHAEPEHAVTVGLYFVLKPLQTALLHGGLALTADDLAAEAKRLLTGYLA